jgi:CubicO group peptidase (beta-lactamase class C family)
LILVLFIVFSLGFSRYNPQLGLNFEGSSFISRYAASVQQSSFVWRNASAEQQGMNSTLLNNMTEFIQNNVFTLHSILISRNNYLVCEEYFAGHNEQMKHEIWSCTKSITSTLVGIAIDQGYFSIDDAVIDLFPTMNFVNPSPQKERLTVEHLLTMTTGLEWDGDDEYVTLYGQHDWVQYVLDKPMMAEPGTVFNYHTGGSHVLSAIIQSTTNMTTFDFAKEYLFGPLGIDSISWAPNPDGITKGGEGIFMRPRDMAKYGLLYLQNGSWEGKQIVPAEWVEKSTSAQFVLDSSVSYGYQWWNMPSIEVNNQTISIIHAARGYLQQAIFVIPEKNMVVVMTANIADRSRDWTYDILSDFIIPAITKDVEPDSSSVISSTEPLNSTSNVDNASSSINTEESLGIPNFVIFISFSGFIIIYMKKKRIK